jgi:hypothetical protein
MSAVKMSLGLPYLLVYAAGWGSHHPVETSLFSSKLEPQRCCLPPMLPNTSAAESEEMCSHYVNHTKCDSGEHGGAGCTSAWS